MQHQFTPFSGGVLALNDLRLKLNLGVPDAERGIPQEVSVSFRIHFNTLPKACETDNINDSVCYYTMTNAIEEISENQHFHTLEYLCHFLYNALKRDFLADTAFRLSVTKCNVPIDNVFGGASFECGDPVPASF